MDVVACVNHSFTFISRRKRECLRHQRPLCPDERSSAVALRNACVHSGSHKERGWAAMWRCEQLCVCKRARGPPPLQINCLFLGQSSIPSPLSVEHTQLGANTDEMPEEAQRSSSSSVPGHEGSLSLMSLFVFFQSAASSDGGEYTSWFSPL